MKVPNHMRLMPGVPIIAYAAHVNELAGILGHLTEREAFLLELARHAAREASGIPQKPADVATNDDGDELTYDDLKRELEKVRRQRETARTSEAAMKKDVVSLYLSLAAIASTEERLRLALEGMQTIQGRYSI